MGRFLAFLFVFILGAVVGVVGGGLAGLGGGAYVGACEVIDQAVTEGTMTQDQANAIVKSIAARVDIKAERKQQIIEQLKKADKPVSPCSTAVEAL